MLRDVYRGQLFVGDAISARDLKQIYDHEIAAVLDLAANESPAVLGRDIIYCRFPISDDGSNDDALLSAVIEYSINLLEHNFRTLVACSAGMSRSPIIAASAMSIVRRVPLDETILAITANAPRDVSPSFFASVQKIHARLVKRHQSGSVTAKRRQD